MSHLLALSLSLIAQETDQLWEELASPNPARAYEALWTLSRQPKIAIPLLERHLLPTATADEIARMIAELGRDEPERRSVALASLRRLGLLAESDLRRARKEHALPEVRGRVADLLGELDRPNPDAPENARQLRAVRALELAGTAEARRILEAVAKGTTSPLARARAKAALEVPPSRPVVVGAQGLRAFDDLARYYTERREPDAAGALRDLESTDAATRAASGSYLHAILAQAFDDERNGRAEWKATPFWGGGSENEARELRKRIAAGFGERASAVEALEAALWLLEKEGLAENQEAGARALRRIRSPRSEEAFRRFLSGPHPNGAVVRGIVEEAGMRGMVGLAPEIRRLSIHYRTAVRDAARAAAGRLGLADLPEYRPEKAFTPWLEAELQRVRKMARTPLFEKAALRSFKVTDPEAPAQVTQVDAWLLEETVSGYRVLTLFGDEQVIPKERTEVADRDPAKLVQEFLDLRSGGDREKGAGLSRRGFLTGQFEPGFVSVPEALVAVWLFTRGDRKSAGELLFPRFDETADDRWIFWGVRDLLGHAAHQQMLVAFSHARDYERASQLAKYLSDEIFEGYSYQPRAKEIATQLERRRDDFTTFVLPTPGAWKTIAAGKTRPEQIVYLAERLRLLNCFQWGQPGGVSYKDPQYREPSRGFDKKAEMTEVVNPYHALMELKLTVPDIQALAPFLADGNFMPTFSYWRDFHPSRELHRVSWVVVDLINEAAHHTLVDGGLEDLDPEGLKKEMNRILDWCRARGSASREQLLLDVLSTTRRAQDFERAAGKALASKVPGTLDVIARRMGEFPNSRDDLVELCYQSGNPESAVPARTWIGDADRTVRFWASMILLVHGDRDRMEGFSTLKDALKEDDGSYLYPRAIGALLATRRPEAVDLAAAILQKPSFGGEGGILRHLFLAGRVEARDYVARKLASDKPGGTTWGTRDGKEIRRDLVEGDSVAERVSEWSTRKREYDTLAPDEDRARLRRELRAWVLDQFDKVRAGQGHEVKTDPLPSSSGRWQLDSP